MNDPATDQGEDTVNEIIDWLARTREWCVTPSVPCWTAQSGLLVAAADLIVPIEVPDWLDGLNTAQDFVGLHRAADDVQRDCNAFK